MVPTAGIYSIQFVFWLLQLHQHLYHTQHVTQVLLHYYTCLTAIFSRTTWVSRHQKDKPFWIIGWQWHHLDHMQIICTSLQIDNHTSTWLLSFYRPDALPAAQPTASKHWRHMSPQYNNTTIVLRPFVWDYPGEPVPEETFTHPPSWSSSKSLSASSI